MRMSVCVSFFSSSILSNTLFSAAPPHFWYFFDGAVCSKCHCISVCMFVRVCTRVIGAVGGVYGAMFVVILRSLKLYAKPHKRTSLNGPFSSPLPVAVALNFSEYFVSSRKRGEACLP